MLEGALAERSDGLWASTEVGVIVPRQNGKGGILEARELWGLFLGNERLQTHTAHRLDTCLEHFRRIRTLIESTPDLDRLVHKIHVANGAESIELKTGQRLNFKARSKGSGRGFSGDLVVLDEAYWLQDLGSLLPTLSAQLNPQIWYTSSSPLPRVESEVLRKFCKRGRHGADRIAYFEWSAESDVSLDDRAAWAAANPALGWRITEEFIEIERGSLEPDEFGRERLGIWEEDAVADPVIDPRDWISCETKERDSKPGWLSDPVTFGIDITPDRSHSTIAAAGTCREGPVGLDIVDDDEGATWVLDRMVDLVANHKPKAVMIDPRSAAGSLIRDLEAAGVTVTQVDTQDLVKATGEFYDDVTAHRLTHRRQPELDTAVAGATKRMVGDAWLWDRRSGLVITPLVAATLARWGHLETEAPPVDLAANIH